MHTDLNLKTTVEIPPTLIDPLEGYFFDLEACPWVLLQKTAADPFFLIGYFKDPIDLNRGIDAIKVAFPEIENSFQTEELEAVVWQNAYKAYVKPWNDRQLHWVPLWSKESYTVPVGAACVYLDAGMAFGTGCHETTQLCASRLVDFFNEQNSKGSLSDCAINMVDAGCGSGILALSARALGFKNIRGFDNDPDAIHVCHENLSENPHVDSIHFTVDDLNSGLPQNSIDFLMANIQTNILMPFSEAIIKSLRPKAHLILSGILSKEIDLLRTHFETELKRLLPKASVRLDSRHKGEWSDLKVEIIACESSKNA